MEPQPAAASATRTPCPRGELLCVLHTRGQLVISHFPSLKELRAQTFIGSALILVIRFFNANGADLPRELDQQPARRRRAGVALTAVATFEEGQGSARCSEGVAGYCHNVRCRAARGEATELCTITATAPMATRPALSKMNSMDATAIGGSGLPCTLAC